MVYYCDKGRKADHGEDIPTIRENPIRCIGKWYYDSQSDMNNFSDTVRQADK